MSKPLIRAAAVALFAGAVAIVAPAAASADSQSSSSSVSSITAWKVGGNLYFQDHNGDDFGLDVTSGIAIDARWASCKISGGTGATKYNIRASGDPTRVLGTNFLATTCLKTQYRGYSTTGSFSSTQYWNYSFA